MVALAAERRESAVGISLCAMLFFTCWLASACFAAERAPDKDANAPPKAAKAAAETTKAPPEGPKDSAEAAKAAKLDINTASEAALRRLKDINEERAKGIIDGRCYGTTAELVERGILAAKIYDKIKDDVTSSKCAPGTAKGRSAGAEK